MDRRLFLFTGVAGLSDPAAFLNTVAPAPVSRSGDAAFDAWSQAFLARAMASGLPEALVREQLKDTTPDPRVLAADHKQPEFTRPVGDYIKAAASAARIAQGRIHKAEQARWLELIRSRYGVDPGILIGIWGLESGYGLDSGDYDVIRSLATLAADGRRRGWAETELSDALRVLAAGKIRRAELKGSWAGAMGQTQFTPEDYLAWAVDEDGDGRRDIWGSSADALGSTANFLAHKAAWRRNEAWAREVVLPAGFDYGLAEGPFQSWAAWQALGVRPAQDLAWTEAELAEGMGLILPAGWTGPAFLILPNHMAIRAYNNSTSYALAVGLLADRIAGRPPLIRPWPVDQPLTLGDRIAAQAALNRLGFEVGEPDGVLGLKTRAATRAWQKSRNLPADGHLSYGLIQALKIEAGTAAPSL